MLVALEETGRHFGTKSRKPSWRNDYDGKRSHQKRIDALDQELLNLLNQRQTQAQASAASKTGRPGTLDFQREEEVWPTSCNLNPAL